MTPHNLRVQFVGVDEPNHTSGVGTWLRKLVPRLRDLGIDARVDLLCFEPDGPSVEWFTRKGVPLRWQQFRGDTPAAVRQCLRWLKEDLPDIYIPNCVLPAYFAAAEARRCGVRTIGVLHSDDPYYWGIVEEFIKGTEQWRLNDLVVVSKFLEQSLANIPPQISLHNIPYGVVIPSSIAARSFRPIRLLYTGRLIEEQKRITEVTRAFCRAVRQHDNLEAWIVGSGPNDKDVQSIISSEGMQDKVILKGWVNSADIHTILDQCHVHVLLSDYEGLPVALLEAMAAGLVPICLDMRSGIRDVVRNMENGIIVADREQSFLDAVSHLVNKPKEWERMSSAARETVARGYSEDRCIGQWKEVLVSNSKPDVPKQVPELDLELPPRNPIFGKRDRRFSRIEKPWYFIRGTLGSARRTMIKILHSRSG